MKYSYSIFGVLLIVLSVSFFSCKKKNDEKVSSLFFGINEDIKLGKQVANEIETSGEYAILDSAKYPDAYAHILRITNNILNSGKVQYRDEFEWKVKLIHDDNTLNAFCAPGGYIYVYTGIIKYLDNEDQLAGVMGHEIAHADRRHTIKTMEKQHGTNLMFQLALGQNPSQLAEMAKGLVSLQYSRDHETDADNQSVNYLCATEYQGNGAAGFFQKLIDEGSSGGTPAFLSTHPSPDNRVENINAKTDENSCSKALSVNTYEDFKNSLPK